jgi:hypothetical protein
VVVVLRAAPAVQRLARVGAQRVELAVVGQRLHGAVHRGQPDRVTGRPQPGVHLLRAVEAVEVLEDRTDSSALTGGPDHVAIVSGPHGNVWRHGRRREAAVFAVTRLRAGDGDDTALAAAATELLAALARRPGFRDGELGRAADDPSLWALVTRWDGVGTYRRALSASEVKIAGAPVWVHAIDEPGAYLPVDDITAPPAQA